MKIKIIVDNDPDALPDNPGVIVKSIYPEVVCSISVCRKEEAIDFVKGACLHAVGDYKHVPNVIEFEVKEKVQ